MFVKILIFYLVTCVGTAVMGALQPHLGLNENIIEITQLGPTFGVLALAALYRRKISVALGSWRPQKLVVRRVLAALIVPFAAFAITLGLYLLFGHGNTIDYTHPSKVAPSPFWIVFVAAFIGAAFEEVGWRSWLQPFLETKYSVLVSSIIVGVLWGLWHVGNFSFGLGFMGLFMVMAIAISIVMGILLRGARRNNLAIATSVHAVTNLYLLLFFNEEKGNMFAITALAAGWVLVAGILAVGTFWSRKSRVPVTS